MWFAGGCESPLGRRRTIDEPAKATLFDPQVSGGEGGAADSLFDMAVDASRVHLSRRSTNGENAKRSGACVLDDYGWGRRPLSGRHSSGGGKRPGERRHRCENSVGRMRRGRRPERSRHPFGYREPARRVVWKFARRLGMRPEYRRTKDLERLAGPGFLAGGVVSGFAPPPFSSHVGRTGD